MTFKDVISKVSSICKQFSSVFARHFLKLLISALFLCVGVPIITLGYLPYLDDTRGMHFIGNFGHAQADLNHDGQIESIRVDAFNFWGGNSGQNILIVENLQSDLLGCWDLGEYRSRVNKIHSKNEIIYVDMITHQKEDSMANPTKHLTYEFLYNYYDHVLVFNNEYEFDFSDMGIRIKPSPCGWNFRFYLLKKEFNAFELKSYMRLLNLLSAELQETHYYRYYKLQDGE